MYTHFIKDMFRDITSLGSQMIYSVLLLAVLGLGQINLFLMLLFGNILAIGIVVGIRIVYFKNRPNKQTHSNFLERIDASSFPSLHTARVWYVGLTFSYFWNYSLFVMLAFGFIAIITTYSRLYLKKHDIADTLGGIVLALILFYTYIQLF